MDAAFILDAIRQKHSDAAIVPELTITDPRMDWEHALTRHERGFPPTRRIDALMMQSFERTAVEIKVTKQDFHLDVEQKRWPWQRVAHRFVYAVPHDLEVMSPHGCALWKVHPDGRIEVVKKAIVRNTPEPLPQEVIQRLMYRAGSVAKGG